MENGQMVNLNIDKDDNLTGNLIDRQDYNKRNLKSLKDISTILNNHGYNMQEKGNLENNFSIIDIVSGENFDEEDNLLKKLLKYYRKKFWWEESKNNKTGKINYRYDIDQIIILVI